MQAIITFFETIIGFIGTIVDSVFWLVQIIPTYIGYLASAATYMPPFIAAFIHLSISLTALFAIIRLI